MSDLRRAIRLDSVYKSYARGKGAKTLFRLLASRFRSTAGADRQEFTLLDIDVEIMPGTLVAIVGENGAGKTTLLKTISGLYMPTSGTVSVSGEVALVVGLGAGMVDELSVTDNIGLYGAVCRIRRSTIRDNMGSILAWADLQEFAEAELRTLSTGMRTRLAFSISRHIDADVVLVDEAFSSGDRAFQQKCDLFFASRIGGAQTYLIATHNLQFVSEFCEQTIWLHAGRVEAVGPTSSVLKEYRASDTEAGALDPGSMSG
jgi:ABC-type polysaccharide/polyol phosphate transport system ATPase subunit